jgi:hypothetical protein
MFDLSALTGPGLAGFAGGLSGLGWTPPSVPVPSFGDMMNLNTVFNTTLGPSGLMGVGGAPLSISAMFSGAIGGDSALNQQGRVPVYGTVVDKVPVYNYQSYAFDNKDQSGQCNPVFVCDANADGQITSDDLMQNDQTSCGCHQYQNGWQNIKDRLGYASNDGKICGRQLDEGVKIWYDDNHDGQVGNDELRCPSDYGIVSIDTNKGQITRKNLLGYQCVPHQAVTGYYNFNMYSSNTGIDNQSFTYEPVTAGSALQQALMNGGGYATLGSVADYSGMPNNWGTTGVNGGTGWSYGWTGSGWGNGYG